MSYEGYDQLWCEKGHYFEEHDLYKSTPTKCGCGAKVAVVNRVDETNCNAHGYIIPLVAVTPEACTCTACGNQHFKTQRIFKIPNKDTDRTHLKQDKKGRMRRIKMTFRP